MCAEVERALSHIGKHVSLRMCAEHDHLVNDINDLCAHLAHSNDYDTEVIEAILWLKNGAKTRAQS